MEQARGRNLTKRFISEVINGGMKPSQSAAGLTCNGCEPQVLVSAQMAFSTRSSLE